MKTERSTTDTIHQLAHRQKKIIAAVDFSPVTTEVTEAAAHFAKLHGSELILLYVVETGGGIADLFRDSEALAKHRHAAMHRLEEIELKLKAGGITVSKMIVEGRPHRAIVDAAESVLAEMVVMGLCGTDSGKQQFVGSNLHAVVRNANCPVVTVNQGMHLKQLKKILVPVDARFGMRELRLLLELNPESASAEVTLLALQSGEENAGALQAFLDKEKELLTAHCKAVVKTQIASCDEISKCIVDFAASGGYDMVWLETHGRNGLASLIEGSVTEDLLYYSTVPVLSLRPVREHTATRYYHENLPV